MSASSPQRETLRALRARILELERGGRAPERDAAELILAGARGPEGERVRLARAALHEIMPAAPFDAAACGFAAAALAGALAGGERPALWAATGRRRRETGRPHGRGLAALGCDPGRLILAHAARDEDALWALEAAARSGALAGVVGEAGALSFTQSRRLAMAAAAGETPILLLRPAGAEGAGGAATRWRVGARPAEPCPYDPRAPGRPRWRAELLRARDGAPGVRDLTFHWPDEDDAALSVDPASGSLTRMSAAGAA